MPPLRSPPRSAPHYRDSNFGSLKDRHNVLGSFASFFTPSSSRWAPLGRGSDGRFGLRRFRAKLTPKHVWHSPRFHSRPATLLRPPFCPFHRFALFLPAAAQVKKETSRKRQKGKKHEIRRSQHTNQRGRGFPCCSIGVRSQ